MAHLTETRSAAPSLGARFTEFRAALAERVARYRAYRSTFAELTALSDRELEDLGICRADIHRISQEAAVGN
ncbi:MAG: DUF1127 domain-containing protein [Rubellimicrobium sp.]|nr:DUF1127 domain-containing protein [Rubellimicrobium sp.]